MKQRPPRVCPRKLKKNAAAKVDLTVNSEQKVSTNEVKVVKGTFYVLVILS